MKSRCCRCEGISFGAARLVRGLHRGRCNRRHVDIKRLVPIEEVVLYICDVYPRKYSKCYYYEKFFRNTEKNAD